MSICTIAPYDKILLQIAVFPFLCFCVFGQLCILPLRIHSKR